MKVVKDDMVPNQTASTWDLQNWQLLQLQLLHTYPITCRHNWTHLALVVARCLAKRFEPRPSDLQTAPC